VKARIVLLLAVLTTSLAISRPAFAHHSMSMYDSGHDTTFKATIMQFDWANPHSQITFTVTDEHGNIEKWVAEGPGPNRLANHGWSKDSLKPGDQVTIVGTTGRRRRRPVAHGIGLTKIHSPWCDINSPTLRGTKTRSSNYLPFGIK
jgi:hypothetical protein